MSESFPSVKWHQIRWSARVAPEKRLHPEPPAAFFFFSRDIAREARMKKQRIPSSKKDQQSEKQTESAESDHVGHSESVEEGIRLALRALFKQIVAARSPVATYDPKLEDRRGGKPGDKDITFKYKQVRLSYRRYIERGERSFVEDADGLAKYIDLLPHDETAEYLLPMMFDLDFFEHEFTEAFCDAVTKSNQGLHHTASSPESRLEIIDPISVGYFREVLTLIHVLGTRSERGWFVNHSMNALQKELRKNLNRWNLRGRERTPNPIREEAIRLRNEGKTYGQIAFILPQHYPWAYKDGKTTPSAVQRLIERSKALPTTKES